MEYIQKQELLNRSYDDIEYILETTHQLSSDFKLIDQRINSDSNLTYVFELSSQTKVYYSTLNEINQDIKGNDNNVIAKVRVNSIMTLNNKLILEIMYKIE